MRFDRLFTILMGFVWDLCEFEVLDEFKVENSETCLMFYEIFYAEFRVYWINPSSF